MTGEIADDDAVVCWLIEKALIVREFLPVGTMSADGNIFHRLIKNDFMPKVLKQAIKIVFIIMMTADVVFMVGA